MTRECQRRVVVSHSVSTSNHNADISVDMRLRLYLIPFLHQTTTGKYLSRTVDVLYLIPFLHQTTTRRNFWCMRLRCISFRFYIKPQPTESSTSISSCCISFRFYIKPQLAGRTSYVCSVVSHSVSTSNHNYADEFICHIKVVSHSVSTSNHNLFGHTIS